MKIFKILLMFILFSCGTEHEYDCSIQGHKIISTTAVANISYEESDSLFVTIKHVKKYLNCVYCKQILIEESLEKDTTIIKQKCFLGNYNKEE